MPTDIFSQIGQLFRNQTPDGDVQVFVLHRFLASDPTFAPFAKELAPFYDDKMIVEIWRSSLPFLAKAPYLKYPAPKKVPAPDDLVRKVADVHCYTYGEAEEVVDLLHKMGRLDEAIAFYGVEAVKKK